MSKTIYIGGRLESKAKGNVVTGANAILDDTKGKKQNVINKETDDELLRLEQSKQDNLNFDNAPTEDSTNPVTSGGVYTAEKALSDAIEAILLLIPSAATALNKLVDTNTMNSSISTATATFRGTYNAVSDLGLTYQATHAQIEAALDALGLTADNNDFAFVQIPVSDQSQDIAKTERFKFNGTNWLYEYDLNTSGFTAAQWAAINSGITVALVTKLTDLPTAAALQLALNAKQDTLTFDNEPTALSQNPVTSGGIYTAIQAVATALSDYSTTTDGRLNVLEGLIPTEASSSNKLTDKAYVDGLIQAITELIPAEATSANQLADKAYVLAQILAAAPAFKGQFTTLAELQAVASPKAGDLGIVRTKDSDGMDVFTVYQYLNNAWNVFYSLSYHPQIKPATTGTTGDYPYNGMGRVELAMNMVNTGTELAPVMVNQLTQDMFYKGAVGSRVPNTNTIFVIRYDYVLAENITIPDNCVLEFEGGSISGDGTGKDTISASYVLLNDWKFDSIKFSDSTSFDFICPINVPVNGAKEFCETILSYKSNTSTKPTIFVFGSTNPYTWTGVLNINKKYVTLTGGGVIQGTIHLGYTAQDYEDLHYGEYPDTAHHCITVEGLKFNKYNIIGTDSDNTTIENFIKNGDVTNTDHIAISLINVNHVKISNCFFDNVPYPIVFTPNSTYVNQNVRRLIIDNCDFERCKIGIYVPTELHSDTEYGDLIVINSYFFPYRAGIVAYDIDGFKCYNNVMNTSTIKNAQGVNMELHKCSQVVITNNSFYGEYNKYGLLMEGCGNTNISANSFCVQRTSYFSEEVSDGACIDFTIGSTSAIPGVSICNNLFSNCELIPIFVRNETTSSGRINNLTIQGNTVSGDRYSISSRIVYCITGDCTNMELQRNYYPELTNYSQFLDVKLQVLDKMLNTNDIRSNQIRYINEQIFNTQSVNKSFRVRSITKTTPIIAMRVYSLDVSSYSNYVTMLFNGTIVKIPTSLFTAAGATQLTVLNGVKDIIDRNFSTYFDTTIIAGVLWIKGKSSSQVMPSICLDRGDKPITNIQVLYQNLGYNIALSDTDKKNHIFLSDNNLTYCGIDANDNDKIVVLRDKLFTLKTIQNGDRYGSLYFREGSDLENMYLYEDAFFTKGQPASGETAATILADIVNFCYSDRFSISGTTITSLTKNIEYGFTGNWAATRGSHVVDYQFLTPEGKIYDPITDTYTDPN